MNKEFERGYNYCKKEYKDIIEIYEMLNKELREKCKKLELENEILKG